MTSAKSQRLGDCFAAVNKASNCRCVKPKVGDSGGTWAAHVLGRGMLEYAVDHARPVETATTDMRRDTVDGRYRRVL